MAGLSTNEMVIIFATKTLKQVKTELMTNNQFIFMENDKSDSFTVFGSTLWDNGYVLSNNNVTKCIQTTK